MSRYRFPGNRLKAKCRLSILVSPPKDYQLGAGGNLAARSGDLGGNFGTDAVSGTGGEFSKIADKTKTGPK